MHSPIRSLAIPVLLGLAALVTACTGAASPGATSPGAASPSPRPSSSPSPLLIDSPGAAAAAVAAVVPLFSGFKPKDPAMIGASSWYEAARTEAAKPPTDWRVVFTAGWGDCPAGCIDRHTWTYIVRFDGTVELQAETGPAVPADVLEALRAG